MYAPQARTSGGSATIYSKAFGDQITVDHIITADAKDYGFQEEAVAHVVKDVYSKFRYVYPSKTKSGEQCYEDTLHFLGVDDEVKVIYSDNAFQFDYAARQLRARHNTSREYVNENKAVIEKRSSGRLRLPTWLRNPAGRCKAGTHPGMVPGCGYLGPVTS